MTRLSMDSNRNTKILLAIIVCTIACFLNTAHGIAGSNTEAVNKLRRLIDEKYSYRDLRGLNWDQLFRQYGPRMDRANTTREFAEVAAQMMAQAKDAHLWVKIGNQTIGGSKRNIFRNYNLKLLQKIIPSWRQCNDRVSSGRIDKATGYIMINSWATEKPETLDTAFDALRDLSDCRSLIIDVRPNGGGGEGLAAKFAGCFIDKPAVYAKDTYRDVAEPNGWTKIRERTLSPNPDQPRYQGHVAVLMGQACMSSCESFLLMMKQSPDCVLIGGKSYGSSGNPKPYDLGNGVTVWLPSWKDLRPDGTCFEGEGIKPDILVSTNEAELRQRDKVLEAAINYLRNKK
jgi:C-terminal processing protease CtpA/Prc